MPAAKKDLCAADDMTEQFLNAVLRDSEMGLDGLSGFDGFRAASQSVGVERFLGAAQQTTDYL